MNKLNYNTSVNDTATISSKSFNEEDLIKQENDITQIRMEQVTQKQSDLQMVDTLKESLIDSNDLSYLNSFLVLDPHTFDQDKEK